MRRRDRVRIEWIVQRVGAWLDLRQMPGRRRREVLRELRANLAAAAAADELEDAIERLGEPRMLAAAYLESEPVGVRWRTGLVAAALVALGLSWLSMVFVLGFAEGVQAVGPEPGTVYETGGRLVPGSGALASFESTGDGFWMSAAVVTWVHVAAVVATFVLVARPWRAAARRRPVTADRP